MNFQEFLSREKARCDSFKLLAACFYQPQISAFREERLFENLSDALKQVCVAASVDADNMGKSLQVYSEEEMLVDYARLFVGPAGLQAAPYGSIYLEKDGRVMGHSTMEVVAFYTEHGLVMDGDFKDMPDHIAAELEFLYYLVFNEIQALEASDIPSASAALEAQGLFMDKFLHPWANLFADKIMENAETGFYKALAACLSSFIYETDIQGGLPEELKKTAVA